MGILEDALDFAEKIQAAHDAADTPELQAVHDAARVMLYRYGEAAGLTPEEISEVDNHNTTANRGGTPKGPAPQ